MNNEKILICPFNKNHLISTNKILSHLHRCKDGKGKIDKLIKCKKDFTIMFFDKEEHSKNCRKCYKYFFEKDLENLYKLPLQKNENNSDSMSIITECFGENKSVSSILSRSDIGSFMHSDISAFQNERKFNKNLNNANKLNENLELSDIDYSYYSRKI
jgi:hypothetical protein